MKKTTVTKALLPILAAFFCLLFGLMINPIEAEAAASPAKPKYTLTTANNGSSLKITISKTKNADGYYIVFMKENDDVPSWLLLEKNGKAKRTWTSEKLPDGKYAVIIQAYRKVNGKELLSQESEIKKIDIRQKEKKVSSGSITLEFSDGSTVSWSSGGKAVSTNGKKLKYVYFGSYPQSEVTGSKLTSAIKKAKYNSKGIATVKGVTYYRTGDFHYKYYKVEPIKWRVLSRSKGKIFLMSEYALEIKKYHDGYYDMTWENCDLRSWLNNDFYKTAFSTSDTKFIKTTKLTNKANPFYKNSVGGNSTKDKVFILSIYDLIDYCFDESESSEDINRRCGCTDYCLNGSVIGATWKTADDYSSTSWWVRTPGTFGDYAVYVDAPGSIQYYGGHLNTNEAVRPAINIDISSILK